MKCRRIISLLLLAAGMLCSCEQAKKPENPYRLKTQIHETYHADRTQTIRTEYIYDENGWLTETQTFQDDEWWYTTKFIRDANGNDHGRKINYADGTQMEETMLTTDDQGRMITSESYQNSQVTATTEYGYSADGQIIRLHINRLDALNGEDLKSFVDSTYDRKGKLIRQDIRWEPNGTKEYTLYTYEKDKLSRTESYTRDELNDYTDYIYSEEELVQVAIAHQADGTLQGKHVTTFDEYGNELEVVAHAYASELARFGQTDEEPDSRTIHIYELK